MKQNRQTSLRELDILLDLRKRYGKLFSLDDNNKPTFEVTVEIANYVNSTLKQILEGLPCEEKVIGDETYCEHCGGHRAAGECDCVGHNQQARKVQQYRDKWLEEI